MISKVYKSKVRGNLVVYLPNDVVNALALGEGDSVDFVRQGEHFVIVRRAAGAPKGGTPSGAEISVLKKMDTVRYNQRTKKKIASILTKDERKVVVGMLKKKFVSLYKKSGEPEEKFGIAKWIYENYLMRKGAAPQKTALPFPTLQAKTKEEPVQASQPKKWERGLGQGDGYLSAIEEKGYLVIPTETEAAAVSVSLEESIRRGMVVGVRAFNKKFYIATRNFVSRAFPKINKMIGLKGVSVSEISRETGLDEDGIRAVLYIMAESGDVTEVKRDVFKAA